ncbi:MAG: chemotaxis protein CheD [Desulfobulbaceae bacterium]|nr:chemotaxis protein CheD [Desulfobulbaceae bacterium]
MKHIIASHVRHVYLKPGEALVSRNPLLVGTVLGSCVAVAMFSPGSGVGAICHAMLPDNAGRDEDLRYVDTAVRCIHRKIIEYGAKDDIVIKLFGGAQVLALGKYAPAKRTIGEMNVARAEEILNLLGLTVANADIGGIYGRKLYFSTMNGDVYLRRMGPKPASLSGIKQ